MHRQRVYYGMIQTVYFESRRVKAIDVKDVSVYFKLNRATIRDDFYWVFTPLKIFDSGDNISKDRFVFKLSKEFGLVDYNLLANNVPFRSEIRRKVNRVFKLELGVATVFHDQQIITGEKANSKFKKLYLKYK